MEASQTQREHGGERIAAVALSPSMSDQERRYFLVPGTASARILALSELRSKDQTRARHFSSFNSDLRKLVNTRAAHGRDERLRPTFAQDIKT